MYLSATSEDPHYFSQLENRLKKSLPSDIWLPDKPEVEQIIENRLQHFEMSLKKHKS